MNFETKTFHFTATDPCVVIAEIGVNHNGDPMLAKQMVDAARKAGSDIVKFQAFRSEKEISKFAPKTPYQEETTTTEGNQLEMCRALEFDADTLLEMKAYCRTQRVGFLCTAFEQDSADMLANTLQLDSVKIPSGEITNLPFLEYIGKTFKGVVLSTGASTLAETEHAVEAIMSAGYCEELLLFHCVTSYPAAVEDVNLSVMKTMRDALGYPVGFSDHTIGISVPIAAAALGAAAIEKHFTLDRTMIGPDHRASIEPEELAGMVRGIREGRAAVGVAVKRPQPCELPNINLVRKGLVAARDLRAGEILTEDMIEIKRPAQGIHPADFQKVMGMVLTGDVEEDAPIRWDDLRSRRHV